MGASGGHVLIVMMGCALWLGGCGTSGQLSNSLQHPTAIPTLPEATEPEAEPEGLPEALPDSEPTGSIGSASTASKGARGKEPNDDVRVGKKHFQAGKYALAERHFSRAVEKHPRDVDAWTGLAASYDRLRQFERADVAYAQATKIAGPTPELLNNRGYSYMLRGDYRRARETLRDAQAQDPGNPYIQNNLELLEASVRKGKAIQ
jgi:tetratricopeptide (TPR) repeat protein